MAYSNAGIDTGEIVIRGGSHLDFSWIPNQAFGASLRGPDITDWYTSAWFDKYLKHQPGADAKLLSERWRQDPVEASVDPNHDPNAFSFYYYSRLDIPLADGRRFDCEDLRAGCAGMVPAGQDGYPGNYSYISIDTSPDAVSGPGASLTRSRSLGHVHPQAEDQLPPTSIPRSGDHARQGIRRPAPGADPPRPSVAVGHDPRPARQPPAPGARLGVLTAPARARRDASRVRLRA